MRVDAVTIYGTDLHILEGDVPEVERGRILGHTTDGVQAEYARVPFADTSTYVLPAGVGEVDEAYDVFAHPQDSNALKVALFRS